MAYIKETFTQDLTSGSLTFEYESTYDMQLKQITIKASTNITETIDVTIVQKEGTSFDILIDSSTLNSESNYVLVDKKVYLKRGDKLRVTCTNANTTSTISGTLLMEVENVRT